MWLPLLVMTNSVPPPKRRRRIVDPEEMWEVRDDPRWVLDETSDTQCLIWVGEESPEPILVVEIEPAGEGPVENPSASEPSGSSSPKRVEPEKQ